MVQKNTNFGIYFLLFFKNSGKKSSYKKFFLNNFNLNLKKSGKNSKIRIFSAPPCTKATSRLYAQTKRRDLFSKDDFNAKPIKPRIDD